MQGDYLGFERGVVTHPGFDHAGAGGARTDGIDAYALRAELERGRFRETDHAVFRRDISAHAGEADQTRTRRSVDDRSPLPVLEDARDLVLHTEKHTGEHHVDGASPIVDRRVGHGRAGARNAGVVVREIEASVVAYRGGHRGFDLLGHRHIGVYERGFTTGGARLRDGRFAAGVVDIAGDHRRAVLGKQLHRRTTDTRRRARDDRNLAVELTHRLLPGYQRAPR